jgi:hypothetical protein
MGGACDTYAGEERCTFTANLKERDLWKNSGVAGKVGLQRKWKSVAGTWTGVMWLWIGEVAGCCDAMIKPMGSIKCGGFLDQPRISLLFRKDPAPCS